MADTSVWIDHFRSGDVWLSAQLAADNIAIHPFVIGEIALGTLARRDATLQALRDLPKTYVASDDEVSFLIEREALHGKGIGYVDAHLLAACRLTPQTRLWTHDKRLAAIAERLAVAGPRRG